MAKDLKRNLKTIKIEVLKNEDFLFFIQTLNTNYKFKPVQKSLIKQISIDKNREVDFEPKYSSLPVSFKNKKIIILKEVENLEIKTIQIDKNQFRYIYDSIGLRVEIYKDDLVETTCDVIVNAANQRLRLGGNNFD